MRKAIPARLKVGALALPALLAGWMAWMLAPPAAAVSACSNSGCGACTPPTSDFGISTLISAADLPDSGETVMAFVDPNDGSSRRFVVSQEGFIWVWDGSTGSILGTAFINLAARVLFVGERGLFSMAVSPDYVNDGEFYVYYTGEGAAPGDDGDIVIERYTRSANPNIANATPTSILVIAHPSPGDNGGALAFGPDGHLYVSTGDGGGHCDSSPGGPNAQNIDELLGKILRLDVAGVDPGATAPECESNQGYLIPTGNPFRGVTPGCGEIWSVGLRNPFRMSFDRETGDIFCGDVGLQTAEEINFVRAGLAPPINFGWKCREGCDTAATCPNGADDLCPDTLPPGLSACQYGFDADPTGGTFLLHDPILCHSHDSFQAIMGGYLVRGQHVPELSGRYLYGDYICGQIWATSSFDRMNPATATSTCWEDTGGLGITGFGEDHLGEIYIVRGGDQRIDCIHDGNPDGCFWAAFRGLFEDDFESSGTGHWSLTVE